jgi:predicted RNase H-like HicB family nuclease
MASSVTINIKVPADIYKDGQVFVASCPRFGVITQGVSFEEAKNNLFEAMTLFIETCLEMGTLEEVLRESGFKLTHTPEDVQDNCPEHIELSFPFLAQNHLRECRA